MNNVILIGPMGAGKSTIGQQLSQYLHWQFIDSDQEIIHRQRNTISEIFAAQGELAFRQYEEEVIRDSTKGSKIILATGGGAVLSAQNRERIALNNFVIYLKVSLPEQLKRLEKNTDRPLLNSPNVVEQLETLQQLREPFYNELANLIIDTNNKVPSQIVAEIIHSIKSMSIL